MKKTRVEFYATSNEQRSLLCHLLKDSPTWCVVRTTPGPQTDEVRGTRFLAELDFSEREGTDVSLFIGHRRLSPSPTWRTTGGKQRDIDFVQSRAIQYVPSLIADNRIMLKGQLAIMRDRDYVEAGLDPAPLHAWFDQVANALAGLRVRSAVVVQQTTLGTIKEWPDIVLTPGVVDLRRQGYSLKEFSAGSVEFDVSARPG